MTSALGRWGKFTNDQRIVLLGLPEILQYCPAAGASREPGTGH